MLKNVQLGDSKNCKSGVGDTKLVIQDCTEIIDTGRAASHDLAGTYNIRGVAVWIDDVKDGRQRAVSDFNAAIRLRPDFVDALNNRGSVLTQLGSFAEATRDFEAAIAWLFAVSSG